jgi:hypothetical protein
MEIGIVVSFAYWGYILGQTSLTRVLCAVVTPVVGFGLWGAVDFHQFGRISEALRLIEELIISGIASIVLYETELYIFAFISVVYHILVYIW